MLPGNWLVINNEQRGFVMLNTHGDFERGFSLFHERKYNEAGEFFHRILRKNPHDEAAKIYMQRCEQEMSET